MRTVDFTDKAYSDIDYFKKSGNTVILRKINSLIQNILESPFEGIGKTRTTEIWTFRTLIPQD